MNRFHRAALVAALACSASGAFAQSTQTKSVDVSVTFTSTCRITSAAGNVAIAFGNYTAFASDVVISPVNVDFECSRNFSATPVLSWDAVAANQANGGGVGATTAVMNGTLRGLRYELRAIPGTSTPGSAPDLSQATPTNGTPLLYSVGVGGTLFSGAGDGAAGPTSETRVLTVQF